MDGWPSMDAGVYRSLLVKMSSQYDWEGRPYGEDDEEIWFSDIQTC